MQQQQQLPRLYVDRTTRRNCNIFRNWSLFYATSHYKLYSLLVFCSRHNTLNLKIQTSAHLYLVSHVHLSDVSYLSRTPVLELMLQADYSRQPSTTAAARHSVDFGRSATAWVHCSYVTSSSVPTVLSWLQKKWIPCEVLLKTSARS